jgi:ZIP family zinc transporter
MSGWPEAAAWGLVAGSALIGGALVGWFLRVRPMFIASVMAFGAGVLISALAFDLALEAQESGGLTPTVIGIVAGAVGYVGANSVLARYGAHHRKRSNHGHQPSTDIAGSGTAIAVGSLLDGIPESVVLGASLLDGTGVSTAVVAAVVISNLPEGLSSAAGMRAVGRSRRYVITLWSTIALVVATSAALGYVLLADVSPEVMATITAVAAGAILTMVADTMIPEAFERAHMFTGLVTTLGFLTAFAISRAGA